MYSEERITLITKMFVIFHGCLVICLAYAAQYIEGPVTQMAGTVLAACGSPILGLFIIGATVPWANKYGAVAGALVAFSFNFWIGLGNMISGRKLHKFDPGPIDNCEWNSTDSLMHSTSANISRYSLLPYYQTAIDDDDSYDYGFFLYDISYEWYGFIGAFISVSVGLLVSYFTRSYVTDTTEAKYIFPFMRKYWTFDDMSVENRVPKEEIEMGDKTGILIENKRYSSLEKQTGVSCTSHNKLEQNNLVIDNKKDNVDSSHSIVS